MGARKKEHVCNHEETDKPELKDKLQNKWPTLFRKHQGHEREKLRTKETQHSNITQIQDLWAGENCLEGHFYC